MAVRSNAREIAAKYEQRSRLLPANVSSALVSVREQAVKISLGHMQRLIYDIPIPTRKNGKPKWRRTGQLRRREKAKIERTAAGARVVLINNTRYAEVRHEMGKPKRRETDRKAHWRDEARDELRAMAVKAQRRALQEALAGVRSSFAT